MLCNWYVIYFNNNNYDIYFSILMYFFDWIWFYIILKYLFLIFNVVLLFLIWFYIYIYMYKKCCIVYDEIKEINYVYVWNVFLRIY